MNMKKLDRRTFLKGSAVATGTVVVASIAGCSPKEGSTDPEPTPTSQKPGTGWSWETEPDPIPEDNITDGGTYDIVIVGCGTAGSAAVYAAALNGAKTAVIEPFASCTSHGGSIAAVNSKWQLENGFISDPLYILEWYREWTGHKIDQRLVRYWIDNSGHVLDQINEVMAAKGIEPANITSEPEFPNLTMMHMMNGDMLSGGMVLVTPALTEAAADKGAEFFFGHTARQLDIDSSGAVVSIVAEDDSGGYVRLRAEKGIILATGDYAANPEMIRAWCPMAARADADTHQWQPELDKGEGLTMAIQVGAGMQSMAHCPMIHPVAGGSMSSVTITSLRVDRTGERYGHERGGDMEGCNQRMIVAGNEAWTILDSSPAFNEIVAAKSMMGGGLEADLELGYGVQANTIEDLAAQMGVPVSTFKASIERYNELCAKGTDDDFGKAADEMIAIETPPYTALKIPASLIVVLGGLNVDHYNRVLTAEDDPIPNLYAVGNVAGNFYANDYPLEMSGLSLGRALTQGYMTAETLAKV
jgi:fumarate reductase flavoprotein subunit